MDALWPANPAERKELWDPSRKTPPAFIPGPGMGYPIQAGSAWPYGDGEREISNAAAGKPYGTAYVNDLWLNAQRRPLTSLNAGRGIT